MSKYIVHYLHGRDLGESIRQLVLYDHPGPGPRPPKFPRREQFTYKDKRYTLETWPEFKPKTPFGQLPVLEIDGKHYAQTIAICRYMANKRGLAGQNAEEAFEIDQNVDFVNDICTKAAADAAALHYESDEAANVKRQEENFKNVHVLLEKLNTLIEKNNGYLALGKFTWGDLILVDLFDNLKHIMKCQDTEDIEEKYPAIKRLLEGIGAAADAAASHYESDEAANVKRQEENFQNVHVLLEKLNNLIEKNNGYLALGKFTWGDFILVDLFDNLKHIMKCQDTEDIEEKYPAIKRLLEGIGYLSLEEEDSDY